MSTTSSRLAGITMYLRPYVDVLGAPVSVRGIARSSVDLLLGDAASALRDVSLDRPSGVASRSFWSQRANFKLVLNSDSVLWVAEFSKTSSSETLSSSSPAEILKVRILSHAES